MELEIRHPPPWVQPGEPIGEGWKAFNDTDLVRGMIYLQASGFAWASEKLVYQALIELGERNVYDPLQAWEDSLVWDGKERGGRLFIDYFPGVVADADGDDRDHRIAYLEHAGRNFLTGGMARLADPGCKCEEFPVLISPQGWGKSSGVRALAPLPEVYTDDLPNDLGDAEAKRALRGKWICELSELAQLTGDARKLKKFFSTARDRLREVFGRFYRDVPRRAVFISTVNELELTDTTGNRRYQPIELARPVDVAAIERDRDQLWAEGKHLFQSGAEWWLPPRIAAIAAEEAADFLAEDPWYAPLADWADRSLLPFPIAEALSSSGLKEIKAQSKADQGRAAACLRRAGYDKRRDREGSRVGRPQPMLWFRYPQGAEQ
jgi:predicted P-loop ATPase